MQNNGVDVQQAMIDFNKMTKSEKEIQHARTKQKWKDLSKNPSRGMWIKINGGNQSLHWNHFRNGILQLDFCTEKIEEIKRQPVMTSENQTESTQNEWH